MTDNKKVTIENGIDSDDIYFLKIGKIRYLKSKNYKKDCCQICGKKRRTTAHHLIPKRARCICPYLAEVRIRVCLDCDKQIHPENKLIRESDVVSRQSKKISELREFIRYKDSKIKNLTNGLKNIEEDITILLGSQDESSDAVKCKKIKQKEVNKNDK